METILIKLVCLLEAQNPDYLFDRGRYNEEANDNKKKTK